MDQGYWYSRVRVLQRVSIVFSKKKRPELILMVWDVLGKQRLFLNFCK
jgi:hypothetical protein